MLPARLRRRVDALRVSAVAPRAARPRPQADSAVLVALGAAVHAREVLRFDYAGPGVHAGPADPGGDLDPPPRRVEPHHLVTWGARWYLVAWDLDRQDWRTFRADRIAPRTPPGPRFVPRDLPGGDVAAFVAGRFQGVGGWACRGEVLLDLPAHVVAGYADDGLVEPLGPHRCRLALGSWSWTSLAAAVARFDADFEVVGPPELADAFARLARRCAAAAAGGRDDGPSRDDRRR